MRKGSVSLRIPAFEGSLPSKCAESCPDAPGRDDERTSLRELWSVAGQSHERAEFAFYPPGGKSARSAREAEKLRFDECGGRLALRIFSVWPLPRCRGPSFVNQATRRCLSRLQLFSCPRVIKRVSPERQQLARTSFKKGGALRASLASISTAGNRCASWRGNGLPCPLRPAVSGLRGRCVSCEPTNGRIRAVASAPEEGRQRR